ncbi:MAG: tetratricopeptide repeat protein, partial [Clostridia bacterium]|nr:tetratricopeptide repeat protein [Clostridia bacterium]
MTTRKSRSKRATKIIAIILAASLLISSIIVLVSGAFNLFNEDIPMTSSGSAAAPSLEELEQQVQANPENAALKLQLADAYYAQSNPEQAVSICQEILAQNPNNSSAKIYLATLYSLQEQNEEACTLLKEVIAQNPEQSEAYYILDRILAYDLADYAEAGAYLT